MNRFRTAALAALAVCAVSLGAAGTASAQEPAATPLTKKVALTGTKGFKGTYTIDRFATPTASSSPSATSRARCARTARPSASPSAA